MAKCSGRLFRFSWRDEDWEAPTEVTFEFEGSEPLTIVRVIERGLGQLFRGAEVAQEHRAGWQWHLDKLRQYVETMRRE